MKIQKYSKIYVFIVLDIFLKILQINAFSLKNILRLIGCLKDWY